MRNICLIIIEKLVLILKNIVHKDRLNSLYLKFTILHYKNRN